MLSIDSKKLDENHLSLFSGRFDVHLQVIQPILKFLYLISTIKFPQNTSFEIRISLKRMPSLVYTEMDPTKYRVSSMFAFGCIIWTLLHVFTCTYSGWLFSGNGIIGNKNGIPLR